MKRKEYLRNYMKLHRLRRQVPVTRNLSRAVRESRTEAAGPADNSNRVLEQNREQENSIHSSTGNNESYKDNDDIPVHVLVDTSARHDNRATSENDWP